MMRIVRQFAFVLGLAFLLAVLITTCISLSMGYDFVPIRQLAYDLILALFIALVQLLWIGTETDNKAYLRRSILNFTILLVGYTVLMALFGWLPPVGWPLVVCYAGFIGFYAAFWVFFWKRNRKRREQLNEKLKEIQKEM